MNGLILGFVIEAIGAIAGGLGSYRAYNHRDVITSVLMAIFAVCCVLLGSTTAGVI